MTLRATLLACCFFATVLLPPAASRGALVADQDGIDPLCDEESVYGTFVVIDEKTGFFGLLGTRYKFQSMDELDLEFLQGRMVKIDIGRDCGILDIRVLDSESEAIT